MQQELFDTVPPAPNEGENTTLSFTYHVNCIAYTQHFFTELQAAAQGPSSLVTYVLVPNNLTGQYLKQHLALLRGQGGVGLYALTFQDLAKYLQAQAQMPRSPLSSDLAAVWFKSLAEEKKLFKTDSAGSAYSMDFYRALLRSFQNALNEGLSHLPQRSLVSPDWAEAFGLFQNHILSTSPTSESYLAQTLSPKMQSPFAPQVPIWVYGFSHFTQVQWALLEKLSHTHTVHIFATCATLPQNQVDRLAALNVSPHQPSLQAALHPHLDIYADPVQEIKKLVGKAAQLHQTENVPWRDMLILLKRPSDQAEVLSQYLRQQNIPHRFPTGKPLAWTPLGRWLNAIQTYFRSSRSAAELMELLFAYPPCCHQHAFSVSDVHRVLRDALCTMAHHIFSQRLPLYAEKNPRQATSIHAIHSFLQVLLEDLDALYASADTWEKQEAAAKHFFTQYAAADPHFADFTQGLTNLGLSKQTDINPAWASLYYLLDQHIQRSGLTQDDIPLEALVILPASYAQSITAPYVFLPDLCDENFPGTAPRDPLLSDRDKQRLNEDLNTHLVTESSFQNAHAPNAFLNLCHGAQRALFLSYARYRDTDHHTNQPSPYLQSYFPDIEAHVHPLYFWQAPEHAKPAAGSPYAELITHVMHSEITAEDCEALAQLYPPVSRLIAYNEDRYSSQAWSIFDGMLPQDGAIKAPPSLSASQLETYATCPKKYFYRYVLKIRAYEDLRFLYDLRPLDKGILMHDILCDFFQRLDQAGRLPLQRSQQATLEKELLQCAQTHFKDAFHHLPTRFPHLWLIQQRRINNELLRLLRRELLEETAWQPRAFEASFGKATTDQTKGLSLLKPDRDYRFHGKIDRLDTSAQGDKLRLIDYKTGKLKSGQANCFDHGTSLQLPLYLLAAKELYPHLKMEQSYGELWSTNVDSPHDRKMFAGSFLQSQWDQFLEVIDLLVDGISSKQYFPHPGRDGSNCRYCEYQANCGQHVMHRSYRRRHTEASERHFSLEEVK